MRLVLVGVALATTLVGVLAGSVAVHAATTADAALGFETAGAPPVAGRNFAVVASVESRPVPNGPPFDFTLTVTLPSGVAFVSASAQVVNAQCTTSGLMITCKSRSIGGEITSNITFTFRAAAAGFYTLGGSVVIDGDTDSNPANNKAELAVQVGAAPASTPCVVPRVVGKTLAAARQAIVKAGCRAGTVRRVRSATVRTGRVTRQSPAAGRRVARGTAVSLVVSRGP